MRPFGAVLFVDEDRDVAEPKEDFSQGCAFGDDCLGLDADLVPRGVDGVLLVGLALVRDGAEATVLTDAKDLPAGAEVAAGSVVEDVVLVGSGGDEVEA